MASSSTVYDQESQNNERLDSLAAKLSTLRGVTNDIYAEAQNHHFIDSANDIFSNVGHSVSFSSKKLIRAIEGSPSVVKLVGGALTILLIFYSLWGWL